MATGCSNDENEPMNPVQATHKVNSLDNYTLLGELHNAFLDRAVEYMNTYDSTRVIGDEDAVPSYEEWNRQQIAYAKTLGLAPADETVLCAALEEYKSFYDSEQLYSEYFARKNGTRKIYTKLTEMYTSGLIDFFELNMIKTLISSICDYKEGLVSYNFVINKINESCNQWEMHFGGMTTEKGQYSAYVLTISRSSTEWWEENASFTRVAHWIAMDAAGAIVSGGVTAIIQFSKNGAIRNWKDIGWSALGGAVTASTGVVGKLGKWFMRF